MSYKLPNFLIVGAAKSGTTSLHHYLNQHPDVFMSSTDKSGVSFKEPMFMVKENTQKRIHKGKWTLEEYMELFDEVSEEKAIGEASVFYLNFYKEAIPNIKRYLGENTRIIIILRNPVDRAYSAYQHTSRNNEKENLSFEDALTVERERYDSDTKISPMTLYKEMGLYYEMVKAFKDEFKVKIVLYEDFNRDNIKVVKEIFKFLDVNENFEVNVSDKKNVGGWEWSNMRAKKIYKNKGFAKRIARQVFKLVPPLKGFIGDKILNKNKVPNKPMSLQTRVYLQNYYKEDITALEKLLNIDLSQWKT